MITPFVENLADKNVVSYGLTSSGYDIRSAALWKRSYPINVGSDFLVVVDVKGDNASMFEPLEIIVDKKRNITPTDKTQGDYVLLEPQGFFLTYSVEYFSIPEDIVGTCVGKSTWARVGIDVLVTPLEPGWQGNLVIEVVNESKNWVKMYIGEGLAQIRFTKINKPQVTYADRKGKYQNQKGVTHAKVNP